MLVAASLTSGFAVSSGLVWQSSEAAFTATTANAGNLWHAGEVKLTVASAGALFSVYGGDLKPLTGNGGSECVTVTYLGNVPATVRFYLVSQSGALAQYVQLTIDVADGSHAYDCNDFPAVHTNLTTSSDLVWLAGNAGDYTNGLGGWSASSTLTKTYRFTYRLSKSAPNNVHTSTAQAAFGWEART